MDREIDTKVIEDSFKTILEKGLKVDTADPNFLETPARFARAYKEIFEGYYKCETDIKKILNKCFPTEYRGIVSERDITVFSMCPHHFLPVRYEVAVGYVPNGCGLGLSKLTRVVEILAKKPALQESFTQEIVEVIERNIEPKGAICVVKGQHYCMQMRGAKQKDVVTTTSSVTGCFLESHQMELEFYNLIRQ